jgi:hypothetical protein
VALALIFLLAGFTVPTASAQDFNESAPEGDVGRPPSGGDKAKPTVLNKIADLEGCWVSNADFSFPWSSGNYFFYYCFDKAGSAKSYAVKFGEAGSIVTECHFNSDAEIGQNGFGLTEHITNCPTWNPGVFDCVLTGPGEVSCNLRINSRSTSIQLYYTGMSTPELKR